MFFREHHSSNLSFGWSGGGKATIVLEDLGADAPATVTRAVFGMCAGLGVRSPTSSKVQEAGPSHGLGRGVRPLVQLEVRRPPGTGAPDGEQPQLGRQG